MLGLTVVVSQGQTKYVKQNGTGDGSSWANAAGNLKAVLDAATAGTEVWVAEGTYHPVTCNNCTTAQRDTYFQIKDGVKVYGGFAGTETGLGQRDWESHPTILSGNIDNDGDDTNNAFTVVYFQWVSTNTVLDGFIIEKGYAYDENTGDSDRKNSGGGIVNYGSGNGRLSSPTIKNCTIRNNYAHGFGGGFFNRGSYSGQANPHVENCIFSGNTAGSSGGGVMNDGAQSGQANTGFYDCAFDDNNSGGSGGGLMNYAIGGTSNPTFTNCRISGNNATNYGGAMYNHGKNGNASPALINCLIENNTASSGSGIYNLGSQNGNSSPDVINCVFYGNSAAQQCGAFYCNAGNDTGTADATLTNCVFLNNTAPNYKIFKIVYGHPSISYSSADVASASELNDDHHNGDLSIGNGMLYNVDPKFINATNDDFHLADGSPLINSGDNSVISTFSINEDYAHDDRIQGNTVDINIYERASALPVEWITFSANIEDDKVLLKWVVAGQYQNDFFAIERSEGDAKHFEEIGTIAGDGTFPGKKSFQFIDETPELDGLIYYRIKQVDFDGSFSMTGIRVVDCKNNELMFSAFPNPVSDLLTVDVNTTSDTDFLLYDALGRQIQSGHVTPRDSQITFDCSDLQQGIYYLRENSSEKVVKIVVR